MEFGKLNFIRRNSFIGRSLWIVSGMLIANFLIGCTIYKAPTIQEIDHARRLADRGTVFLQMNRFDEADAAYRVSLQVAPNPQALDGLACSQMLQGHFEAANRGFQKLLRTFPAYAQGKANYAQLLDITGNKGAARTLYTQALKNNRENFKIRNNFGVLLSEYPKEDAKLAGAELLHEAFALSQHPKVESNIIQVEEMR